MPCSIESENFDIVCRKDSYPVINLALPPIKLLVCPGDNLNHLTLPELKITLHLSLEVVQCLGHGQSIPVRLFRETVTIHSVLWVSLNRSSLPLRWRLWMTCQLRKDGWFGWMGLLVGVGGAITTTTTTAVMGSTTTAGLQMRWLWRGLGFLGWSRSSLRATILSLLHVAVCKVLTGAFCGSTNCSFTSWATCFRLSRFLAKFCSSCSNLWAKFAVEFLI